jgi:hypothetical protein
MDKVRILSNVTTFSDVQKSLQEIEKILNGLSTATSTEAETEVEDREGESGNIQITMNEDKTYTFEIRTEDGWKTPVIGDSAVKFKDKPAAKAKNQKKSIDEIEADDTSTSAKVAQKTIYDEKADKFIMPRADYDSGWINYDFSAHTISGGVAWRHTHTLGQLPTLIKIYFAPDQESGTMGTGETLTEPQTNVTWFTEITNLLGASEHNNDYYGIVYRIDKDYLYLASGESNSGMYSDWSMSNANVSPKHDGAIRLLLWK